MQMYDSTYRVDHTHDILDYHLSLDHHDYGLPRHDRDHDHDPVLNQEIGQFSLETRGGIANVVDQVEIRRTLEYIVVSDGILLPTKI